MPDSFKNLQNNNEEIENVKVVIRIRPMNKKELNNECQNIIITDCLNNYLTIRKPNAVKDEPPKIFSFDKVFDQESSQVDVYNETARPLIDKVLQGYNGTIFAYGQTGTGKTYTMTGSNVSPQLRGIIPNSFAHIFGHIAKANDNQKFLVRATYLEIYNEEIRDLLGKAMNLKPEIKERPDIGVYVKNLKDCVVNNADDLEKIMTVGNKNRVTGATAMNASSSRSHSIFTITVESSQIEEDGQEHVKMGKLHLVDLAGSERQGKSKTTGLRLREASKINLSLSTLSNVISALVDGQTSHIPYRNSKLTRLLQDSLGGNSKTLMCANVSPADIHYDETISTLRYANRAKNIKNRVHINEDPKDALLRQFQIEIEQLKKQLEENSVEFSESDEDINELEELKENHNELNVTMIKRDFKAKRKADMNPRDAISNVDLIELQRTQSEKEILREKMLNLQNKILVGGENLLEKAQAQEQLLAASAVELEMRKQREEQLTKAIEIKKAERIDIEEKYSSLQEEAIGKTKKLGKIHSMLMSVKAELSDLQHEHQREREELLDGVREIGRELQLQQLIMDSYIPINYQSFIESNVHWNEEIGEWELKCVAYTGNHMQKSRSGRKNEESVDQMENRRELSNMYFTYDNVHKEHTQSTIKNRRSRIPRRITTNR